MQSMTLTTPQGGRVKYTKNINIIVSILIMWHVVILYYH